MFATSVAAVVVLAVTTTTSTVVVVILAAATGALATGTEVLAAAVLDAANEVLVSMAKSVL